MTVQDYFDRPCPVCGHREGSHEQISKYNAVRRGCIECTPEGWCTSERLIEAAT